ncbi:MAG: N-acetylmuramic acid 6-phosphate etherase [Thermotaleaceae bacterium]
MANEVIGMITEQINRNTVDIDSMSIREIVTCINNEDKTVAYAVEKVIPQISDAVELTVSALKRGGRMLFIGAGTSGRLGVLDASECPPTFNTDPELVKGIIAGGDVALRKAVEGIEDHEEAAVKDLKKEALDHKDVVIGIAASGRTPYVIGGLKYAKEIGAKAIGISCNPQSKILKYSDVIIEVIVGPEVISGSTRLKSGTAQKMILNILSTTTMIKLGKTYKNLMVDLQTSNHKLKERAIRILKEVTQNNDEYQAIAMLEKTDWNVKEAIVLWESGCSIAEVRNYLKESEGFVNKAIELALGRKWNKSRE